MGKWFACVHVLTILDTGRPGCGCRGGEGYRKGAQVSVTGSETQEAREQRGGPGLRSSIQIKRAKAGQAEAWTKVLGPEEPSVDSDMEVCYKGTIERHFQGMGVTIGVTGGHDSSP